MTASKLLVGASVALLFSSALFGCAEGSDFGSGGTGGSGNAATTTSGQGGGNQTGSTSQGTGNPSSTGVGGSGQGGSGPVCDEGLAACGADCADLLTDPDHCGSCPNACSSALANTSSTCEAGNCGVACVAGFSDCNSDLMLANSDGCEVDTSVNGCSLAFTFTGAVQTFTVPASTTSIQFSVAGAQGGSTLATNTNYGGMVTGTLSVTPGAVLNIFVGGQPVGTQGGFNGGGAGESAGTGGGGASDIRLNGTALVNRVVVAGGGGGGGFWSLDGTEVIGGQGGGLNGTAGLRAPNNPGGQGGTQTSSGTGTCISENVPAMGGGLGLGGTPAGSNCGCDGYGGGGGYWGGAGSGNCRGGGGGSGFSAPSASNVVHTVGGAPAGNGSVTITLL